MRKLLIGLTLLASMSSFAENCKDRLTSQNWPDDRHEKILKCKLRKISHGDERSNYGNAICFGIKKTQSSDYNNTFYTVLRFTEGEAGSLSDIVAVNSKGEVSDKADSIKIDGDIITMASKHYSFSHGQKWKTESIVDMEDMSLTFNSYDKKFLRYSKTLSVDYKCEVEL